MYVATLFSPRNPHLFALSTTLTLPAPRAHHQDGHEVAGFASIMTGKNSNSSLSTTTAASITTAATPVDSTVTPAGLGQGEASLDSVVDFLEGKPKSPTANTAVGTTYVTPARQPFAGPATVVILYFVLV